MRQSGRVLVAAAAAAVVLHAAGVRAALGRADAVTSTLSPGAVVLASGEYRAPLFLDASDWPGVLRAARDLQSDVERVTGRRPAVDTGGTPRGPDVVIAGTLGRSRLVDALAAGGRIDVAEVAGRWEGYLIQAVAAPLPGVERALVVAGADKRGTIYGLYELSEQIGVSPWYWWADVPPRRRDALFVPAGTRLTDAPVVRYRGIFINDEAPALTGWAQEKFGGFGHRLYSRVFELISPEGPRPQARADLARAGQPRRRRPDRRARAEPIAEVPARGDAPGHPRAVARGVPGRADGPGAPRCSPPRWPTAPPGTRT